jgi:uncharacterized protein (TIGR02996 family)
MPSDNNNDTDLLQACILSPDLDAPRVAYADVLTARADPRGEFMTLQLQAAAAQRAGLPGGLWRPWAADARQLEKTQGQAWTADICPPCRYPVFVRGLVEHVSLSARDFLDNAPQLFERAPIRHLDLTDLGSLAAEFFASPYLATLQSLNLDRCGLADHELALLAASPHLSGLRWLELMRNDIGLAGARALAASTLLPSLRYVGFFGNRFDPTEEFFMDQGVVVDRGLPPDGLLLEEEFGHIAWLHIDAHSDRDIPPRRY